MSWQDWVISVVQILFILALIPSISGKDKPDKETSSLTGTCLVILSIVYATLGLAYSAVVTFVLAYLWFVLASQVYKRDRNKVYHFDKWQ